MTYYGAGFCHVVFEDKDGKGLPALSAVALDGTEARHRVAMHMVIVRRVAMCSGGDVVETRSKPC